MMAAQFELLNKAWDVFSNFTQRYYRIAGYTLCLKFIDSAWSIELPRAFQHLAIDSLENPDFTICLWDSCSTAHTLPDLDWETICRNGYRGYNEGAVFFHYFEHINALSAINLTQDQAYYIVRDKNVLPWWVYGSPLQVILNVWLREHNIQLTHTASVGDNDNALLLTGSGGSGKSTTTLSCLTDGLNYFGEDYCLLEPGATPRVYSIYQSAKWEQHTRDMFPDFEKYIINKDTAATQKALIYYQDIFPQQVKISQALCATIALKVGKSELPVLQTISKDLALKNLMTSTIMQLPLYNPKTLNILKQVVMQLPAYHLTLGTNIQENIKIIRTLLCANGRL